MGAHVAELSMNGVSVVKPTKDANQTHGGIAVLMPYAGRVKRGEYVFGGKTFRLPTGKDGNAIHGFAKDARWKVAQRTRDSVVLACVLRGRGYPGTLQARLRYAIRGNSFSTACSVTNIGERPCPLVVGFHPYFMAEYWRVTEPAAAQRYELQGRYFPTGKTDRYSMSRAGPQVGLDDCFRVSGTVELLTGRYRLKLVRHRMPYLVIYNGRYAEGKSVAIEPYTGLPDAYNNGIGARSLSPGQSFECGYRVTAELL